MKRHPNVLPFDQFELHRRHVVETARLTRSLHRMAVVHPAQVIPAAPVQAIRISASVRNSISSTNSKL